MKIAFIEIQNFRKLKSCRIDFSDKTTVFVGANNSGKTSAMDALILFLRERTKVSTKDFTISNWTAINQIGEKWKGITDATLINISDWEMFIPTLDFWIDVKSNELHYVSGIIPTLNWTGGQLGVRLRLEPKEITALYSDFVAAIETTIKLSKGPGAPLRSLTTTLQEFLNKDGKLSKYFSISAFILDPSKVKPPINGVAQPQELPSKSLPLAFDPFKGLIKVDIINAQRGFSDTNSGEQTGDTFSARSLSTQLRDYYGKHISPTDTPEPEDLEALQAIEGAQDAFDKNVKNGFSAAIKELEGLGYPGFSEPKISLSSKVKPIDSLNHSSAVQFDVVKGSTVGSEYLRLPEKYNGLGYQNLISMVFKLMRFRDEWMRIGKLLKMQSSAGIPTSYEPLHLVLVEEPEAHLHAQVQQVFINKAYGVLRNHPNLEDKPHFTSQLLVSTHSSHLAHEIDFACLRYFRRRSAITIGEAPTATVVNLSEIFGSTDDSTKFAIRYLKTTHCDLFFADAAILVEGPAERMLVPNFIEHQFKGLTKRYLTILEIGGSHAHRLRPLVENLGLITLVITDIDSIDPKDNNKAVPPAKGSGFVTNNATLKGWLPVKADLDDLYASNEDDKIDSTHPVRVAFQTRQSVTHLGSLSEALPYTFEDALIFENLDFFKTVKADRGLMKKAKGLADSQKSIQVISNELFVALHEGNKKAEFALDLLYANDPEQLKPPPYIRDGLEWLMERLNAKDKADDQAMPQVMGGPHND